MKPSMLAFPLCLALAPVAWAQGLGAQGGRPAKRAAQGEWKSFHSGQQEARKAFRKELGDDLRRFKSSQEGKSREERHQARTRFRSERREKIAAFRARQAAERAGFLAQHPEAARPKGKTRGPGAAGGS